MSGKVSTPQETAPGTVSEKDHWPSRSAFYLAAVGSAVGFGNVWRFPSLAYKYGGGAFFVPYLLALFLIGLPILILEISLGQYYQTSVVGVYGSLHRRMRGIGASSVVLSFILVTYYSGLIAWVVNAFFDSFGDKDPWAEDAAGAGKAYEYMLFEVMGLKTAIDDGHATRIVGANAAYSLLVWFFIFLCLAFGMKWTGRIAYFTMGAPVVILFIFFGRSITLEGSEEGIKQYIGQWDWSVLEDGEVWSTAVSQIFFSLSVCFGVMVAYGAACPRTEPAFVNSIVVGISNSLFSFIAGFAVFAALGHLSFLTDTPLSELNLVSFGLVFGSWPVVLGTLPGGEHWVRLLFFNLFLLGIDSAFSLVEAPVSVLMDRAGRKAPKWMICAVVCTLSYICSLLYATDAGLFYLDAVDYYINFSLLLVGFFETFAAGWIFGIEEQVRTFGLLPVLSYMWANVGSVIPASLIWFMKKDTGVWGGFVALGANYTVFLAITLYQISGKVKPTFSTLKEFTFGNVLYLAREMSEVVGVLPWIWAVLIKQFIPQVLLILFINLCLVKNDDGKSKFGHYEGYDMWPYQAIGLASVGFALFIVIVGLIMPFLFQSFDETAHGAIKALDYTTNSSDDDESEVKYSAGVDNIIEEDVVEKAEVNAAAMVIDDEDDFEVDC